MPDKIVITGARQHNLKNISVEIPRNKLVVITGMSGSGKSSLAFNTLYAEGQRRYVESLSAYARQFLDQLEKPDVDFIEGLSPAIAIEQRTSSPNPPLGRSPQRPRSTIICASSTQPPASRMIPRQAKQFTARQFPRSSPKSKLCRRALASSSSPRCPLRKRASQRNCSSDSRSRDWSEFE